MVKNLQKFLNHNGFTVAATGAGSVGQETSFFGPRTLAALKHFQSAYIIPVTGVVDAQTRDLINTIEYTALGKITTTDCVAPKNTVATETNSNKEHNGEIVQNDQKDKGDDKSTSGTFSLTFSRRLLISSETSFYGINSDETIDNNGIHI